VNRQEEEIKLAQSVSCRRVSHTNLVIENLEASIRFLEDVYGGSFMMDLPGPNWHACLIEVGGLIVELFEPKHFMLHGRIGPHYLGIEYEVDLAEARAAVADHGIRIMRDIGEAIHTDPFDGFGVDYEFFGGTFYGPDAKHVKAVSKSPEHWAAHPIGFAGLIGYTHAVADLDGASQFLQSFLGAKPLYETERTGIGARAIGLQIADDVCELVSPEGDGLLLREMLQTGHGIRSTIYAVKDVSATRAYFESRGLRVIDGTAPGSIAVDPRDNLGILFEFLEP
jgi:catechol 2,3-dioxygenase-like lactoylglutathione lyase family enzyme